MPKDRDLGRQSVAAETDSRKDTEAGHIEAGAFDRKYRPKYNP